MDTVDMVEETEHGVRTIVEEIIDKLIEVVVAKAEKRVKSVADGVEDESSNTQVSRGEEDS